MVRRVLVMGCSGSGKSTFARALGRLTGLPVVSIDAIYWKPGWVEPDIASFSARMVEEAEKPSWIIDGNYLRSGEGARRIALADTIYWFDLPRWTCLGGVSWRTLSSYGRVRPEMAPGCPEHLDPAFLRYVWTYNDRQRPKLLEAFAALRPQQRLVRFARRREAAAELDRLAEGRAGLASSLATAAPES